MTETTVTLETARLVLRPATLDDVPNVQKYFNNWNVIRHMGAAVPWPYPDDGAAWFLENDALPRVAKGETYFWAITKKDNETPNELIGVIEFRLIPNENGHRGFWLAEPFWGRGIMTEAVFVVNDFVFDVLEWDEFIEDNASDNVASRVLKEKSGAVLLDTFETTKPDGAKNTHQRWKITRDGWRTKRTDN